MASGISALPHLEGRAEALEALGWTGRDAEWIAPVCLHSGVFARAQFCHHYECAPQTAMRFVRRLTDARVAKERPLPGSRTNQKLCHLHGKSFYRVLGGRDLRHRRWPGEGVLWRRLLSLDAVLESPELHWLPTEQEKVRYFTGLGIDPELLPRRVYDGPEGTTTRFFAWKLPVAGDHRRATFAYADRGLDTTCQLRRWCREHEDLWAALHERGIEIHVHASACTMASAERNEAFLRRRKRRARRAVQPLSPEERTTLEELEAALLADDWSVLRRWGGFSEAVRAAAPLQARANASGGGDAAPIDRIRSHVASRVADDVYAA